MRRVINSHNLRVVKQDTQLPRYGLRKRTALASDDKSHEDTRRHRSPPKRLKQTPASSSAHSPSSRGSAKKRRETEQGQRYTRKDWGKAWCAEAILEESDSQYLIKYEPVEEGAQCEISWQPKVCRLLAPRLLFLALRLLTLRLPSLRLLLLALWLLALQLLLLLTIRLLTL